MIISANGNIYEFNAAGVLALYESFIEGDVNDLLAVVATRPVAEAARSALEASADKLGFGRDRIAWITLGRDDDPGLGPSDLDTLIEGIDPLAIVAVDGGAASALSQAMSTTLVLDAANRARCRTVVAFNDFAAMLNDADAKQKAWHLLKQLR